MNSLHPSELSKNHHSNLLIWALLFMVMLSGLVYLGMKMKQRRLEHPTVPLNTPLQHSAVNTQVKPSQYNVVQFENILAKLQGYKVSDPVVYKMSMVLNDDVKSSGNQDHIALWQQGQKQLTSVKATVHAGIDLGALNLQSLSTKPPVTIHLPPARITLIQIDHVTVYDVKTGQPSTVQLGLSLTNAQESAIKAQIEREFCRSEVLKTTTENTHRHVISLLNEMNLSIIVQVAEPMLCMQTAS